MGVRVCRELEIGVGNRDIVRGTVTAVAGERIDVEIDYPGKFDHVVDGRRITKGTVVSDPLNLWVPCV